MGLPKFALSLAVLTKSCIASMVDIVQLFKGDASYSFGDVWYLLAEISIKFVGKHSQFLATY